MKATKQSAAALRREQDHELRRWAIEVARAAPGVQGADGIVEAAGHFLAFVEGKGAALP